MAGPFTPRSTVFRASNAAANWSPATAVTFPLVPLSSSVKFVVPVTRAFRPGRNTEMILSGVLNTGITVGDIEITGNVLTGYSASITLINSTVANITPTAQIFQLIQE